ncbi:MAG: TolC family protein [Poseidonibacter sp.]|uniref:TolC family protein n=1 Tax=Poseidonibacter sp. TaxID=2321188 RepID=UPI00359D26FD
MLLVKSNKIKLLFCSLISLNLYAQEFSLDKSIISTQRNDAFDLSDKQIKEDSATLKKDWINPIQYQYRKDLGEDYKTSKSTVSINQPIFRSGGIYEAIKYANSTQKLANLELEEQRKILIKNAINFLFLIKKSELNIKKANLVLNNAQIDVIRKKEQVLNGFLDSSFLDNALLTLNTSKHTLIDLKYQKQELINNFHNISSQEYTKFELPVLSLASKKDFLEKSIEIQKAKAQIIKKGNFAYITKAKYLPSVNAFYNYSKYHDIGENTKLSKENEQTFGLTLNIPLDSRTFNDIESKKLDYLKAKVELSNKILDEETFFKNKLEKINMYDDRIDVTKQDLEIYNSILKIINEEKKAQLKTQSDVDTLKNSRDMKFLDLKIYNIDKQIELLEIYTKLN